MIQQPMNAAERRNEAFEAQAPVNQAAIMRLLRCAGEDTTRGGLTETPARYLKAFKAYTEGYGIDPESLLKTFDDGAEAYDEFVIVRDIQFYSLCEHHLAPFFGRAHVAYIPNKRIVGLSKVVRLVHAYSRRVQVQERLTQQIANTMQKVLDARAVGVVIQARHMCMEMRGVHAPGTVTVTSTMLGALRENQAARDELLSLLRQPAAI